MSRRRWGWLLLVAPSVVLYWSAIGKLRRRWAFATIVRDWGFRSQRSIVWLSVLLPLAELAAASAGVASFGGPRGWRRGARLVPAGATSLLLVGRETLVRTRGDAACGCSGKRGARIDDRGDRARLALWTGLCWLAVAEAWS